MRLKYKFAALVMIISLISLFCYQLMYNRTHKDAANAQKMISVTVKTAPNTSNVTAKPPLRVIPLEIDPRDYLLPINFILAKRYPHNHKKVQEAIESGVGLKPFTASDGEKCWEENGVIYRRFRGYPHEKKYDNFSIGNPYNPEVEDYVPFDAKKFFMGREKEFASRMSEKKIIFWHTRTHYIPLMPQLRTLPACPDFPCVITTNKTYMSNSSAMLFAAQKLKGDPPPRRKGQIFIFHNEESPSYVYLPNRRIWKGIFNWTMTFRTNSDIPTFYGLVRRRLKPIQKNYTEIVSKKKKLVVWIETNCNSHGERHIYVRELAKYISIDQYGKCNKNICGADYMKSDVECLKMLSEKYKFFLSFENAVCEEYITEKFFKFMTTDMVVVGRAGNQYNIHASSKTFINTADFPSPKALAERLHQLDKNDEEYMKILRNKDEYMYIMRAYTLRREDGDFRYMSYEFEESSMCHVCFRLWNIDRFAKTIPDSHSWFYGNRHCRARTGRPI